MSDVIIIGAGPAGLSAALYILRAGYSADIIGMDGGALEKAEKIENYFGIDGLISGKELVRRGRAQVERLNGNFIKDEVVGISWNGDFEVETVNGIFASKAVIIASGASRKKLRIKGLNEFEGKGVSYCAVCDAFFFRGKDVALLGSGEYALHEAQELLPLVKSLTLLTDGAEIKADFPDEIKIVEKPVEMFFGKNIVEGARFKDGSEMRFSGVFVAAGSAKAGDLAKKLGVSEDNGKITVDENMRTDIPGVFAAGDCTGGVLQVSVSVGEGAKAALSAISFLREKNT